MSNHCAIVKLLLANLEILLVNHDAMEQFFKRFFSKGFHCNDHEVSVILVSRKVL
jgi:hypothetical protein